MSISQDNTTAIVCEEIFDETSPPSHEEIVEYAKRLGIDPDTEPHLYDLAREGLMAALPKGWSPCLHESSGCYYYYEATTGKTSWEHPLDPSYRDLVETARASRSKQQSLDDDSKATTAKDMDSHEETTLPKEPPPFRVPVFQTKIPTKLAPLRKSSIDSSKRKDYRRSINELKSTNSLMSDRTSRDYTNIQYQDPKFYEYPRLLGSSDTEFNLREIVKRSESMSPRYEKDWEQLSSKFSSEENVIDIDKLSISSFTQSDERKSLCDKFDKEKHPKQLGRQKELTLTGGGAMFLKSNRSRDNTPCQDGTKLEDFSRAGVSVNDNGSLERPKSILREKPTEDDDRHLDEERKSVRFDLDKNPEDIKFTYSDSEEDDWDSEMTTSKSDGKNQTNKKNVNDPIKEPPAIFLTDIADGTVDIKSEIELETLKDKALRLINNTPRLIGNRFRVENVSEIEHFSQITRDQLSDIDYLPTNKFGNIKNIDLVSKSDTESTPRTSSEQDEENKLNTEINFNSKFMSSGDNDDNNSLNKKSRINSEEDVKNVISKQHESEIITFKKELDKKLKRTKLEMEANFIKQKIEIERDLEDKLIELKCQLEQKEQDEIKKLVSEMDEARRKNLEKVRTELESCYEKERQEIFEKLKIELDEKKQELLELRNREIEKMETEFDKTLDEEKAFKLAEHEIAQRHNEKIEEMKRELEKEFDELRNELRIQQREKMIKITEDNEKCLAEILRDFRSEEITARKVYKQRLEEIRTDFSREIEKEMKKMSERATQQETVDYEKIRCEKRLIEDKYKTLKEKYMKLKNDVRLAVERRSKRREGNTTASETEKSASTRTRTDKTESSIQKTTSLNVSTSSKAAELSNPNIVDNSESQRSSKLLRFSHGGDSRSGKFESDDTTTASETMNSNTLRKKKIFAKKATSTPKISHNMRNNNSNNNNNNNITDNPVENIRKQLEKLEDLGDQLPTNENAYTLRYPFQDKVPVNTSSELEFFRHRIHVERDSVKRARETLKAQQNIFQGVQKAWKERNSRATLEQLVQEERDLSDMEVSLHRTKSLLGEKVIHLKHLEQSLERVANAKKNEAEAAMLKNDELTLSDISSASSGFSSTDLDKPDYYQASTEIIANLENLNSEIREIWSVLNKRRGNTVPPPPSLVGNDLRWIPYQHMTTQSNNIQGFGTPNIQSNILSQLTTNSPPSTTTQNIIAQYQPTSGFTTSVGTVERGSSSSNIIERTRNMRDWLRQARIETTNLISSSQATL